jgi:hypothetical protein
MSSADDDDATVCESGGERVACGWPSVDVTRLPTISFRELNERECEAEADAENADLPCIAMRAFERPAHYVVSGGVQRSALYECDDEADAACCAALQCGADVIESAIDALEDAWLQRYAAAATRSTDADVGLEFGVDGDDLCAACDNGDGSDENQIIYCDGCNMPVHQHCYGLDTVASGRWECDVCRAAPAVRDAVACELCKRKRRHDRFLDAWRRVDADRWVHVACVLWIPEAFFDDTPQHAIDIRNVLKDRYKLKCVICAKVGACIQCTFSDKCSTSYHVHCARAHFYELDIAEGVANCDRHRQAPVAPIERYAPPSGVGGGGKRKLVVPLKAVAVRNEAPLLSHRAAIAALAGAFGGRAAPQMAFAERLLAHWRAQRRSRGGLLLRADADDDLLKQSHKAAFADVCKAGHDALVGEYEELLRLRRDLGRAEQLLHLVRERESVKLRQLRLWSRQVLCELSPLAAAIDLFVEQLCTLDCVFIAPHLPPRCSRSRVRTFSAPLLSAADANAAMGSGYIGALLAQLGSRCVASDRFRFDVADLAAVRQTVMALAVDETHAPSLRRHLDAALVAEFEAAAAAAAAPIIGEQTRAAPGEADAPPPPPPPLASSPPLPPPLGDAPMIEQQ